MIKIIETEIPDVKIVVPHIYTDARGFFFESFNARDFSGLINSDLAFVQDNHSRSIKNVLRGLHYQIRQPQGKLVRVVSGEVFDVAVDMRRSSPTFGRHVTCHLSAENHYMLWVPPHFAHGFLALSSVAEVLYKTTDYYSPEHERCLRWDDPDLAIAWPNDGKVLLSAKDQQGSFLKEAEVFP